MMETQLNRILFFITFCNIVNQWVKCAWQLNVNSTNDTIIYMLSPPWSTVYRGRNCDVCVCVCVCACVWWWKLWHVSMLAVQRGVTGLSALCHEIVCQHYMRHSLRGTVHVHETLKAPTSPVKPIECEDNYGEGLQIMNEYLIGSHCAHNLGDNLWPPKIKCYMIISGRNVIGLYGWISFVQSPSEGF